MQATKHERLRQLLSEPEHFFKRIVELFKKHGGKLVLVFSSWAKLHSAPEGDFYNEYKLRADGEVLCNSCHGSTLDAMAKTIFDEPSADRTWLLLLDTCVWTTASPDGSATATKGAGLLGTPI